MKTNTTTKAIIVTFFVASTIFATTANAGSKVKPPVADAQVEVVWYQPILDLLNL